MYSFILAALGLHSCAPAFLSCSKCGPLFIVVSRLLPAVASPVAEHRLWEREFQQLQHTGSVAVICGLSHSAVNVGSILVSPHFVYHGTSPART